MSVQVEIIFMGLIALAFDEEIPVHKQVDPHWEKTSSFDAYLLSDDAHVAGHLPEMLIPRASVESVNGQGSCKDPKVQCARIDGDGYQTGKCDDSDNNYYVWCLDGYQIVVIQNSSGVAQYYNESRPEGDVRHLEYRTPKEIADSLRGNEDEYRQDISWVPELAKISRAAELTHELEQNITSKMEGLRGKVVPVGVGENVWDWCEWSDGVCKESSRRKYDQAFADGVQVSLDLVISEVFLVPRSVEKAPQMRITLENLDEPIRVFNLPERHFAKLHAQPRNGEEKYRGKETWCVATHFKHFFKDAGGATPVPFYRTDALVCNDRMAPQPFLGATDSFCPPVIVKKP